MILDKECGLMIKKSLMNKFIWKMQDNFYKKCRVHRLMKLFRLKIKLDLEKKKIKFIMKLSNSWINNLKINKKKC